MLNTDYIHINSSHANYVMLIIVICGREMHSVRHMLSFGYNYCSMIYIHVVINRLVYINFMLISKLALPCILRKIDVFLITFNLKFNQVDFPYLKLFY